MLVQDEHLVDSLFLDLKEKNAQHVADTLWYRKAITGRAKPFVFIGRQSHVFAWQLESGASEVWGGETFVEQDALPMNEVDACQFVEEMPKPFWSFTSGAHEILKPKLQDEYSSMRIDLCPYRSMEEYEATVWSSKRRRNLTQELRQYDRFSRSLSTLFDARDLSWLLDLNATVSIKMGEVPYYESGNRLGGLCKLLGTASALGFYRCLKIYDGERLAAAEVFVEHAPTRSILSFMGHALPEYSGLGKVLYKEVIARAISVGIETVDVGNYKSDIKLLFKYRPLPTYDVEIV
jgi:hypothetical protein